MLEFTVDQILLQKAVAPLAEIADEANIKYSSEGITMMALTTDIIFMGVLKFRSLDLENFFCDLEGTGGVDLKRLYEILCLLVRDPVMDPEGEEYISFCARDGDDRIQIAFTNRISVTITDKQVKFSILNVEIVLHKERSECIIWGTAEDCPVQLGFDIDHFNPFISASFLTNMVWILHSDNLLALHQLNFPVGAAGNIMLYII